MNRQDEAASSSSGIGWSMISSDASAAPIAAASSSSPATFTSALSDETLLRILQELTPAELSRLQQTSKKLKRLAEDPQIWKQLWIEDFVRPVASTLTHGMFFALPASPTLSRLQSVVASVRRGSSSRKVKSIPRRYQTSESPRSQSQDRATSAGSSKGKERAIDGRDEEEASGPRHDGINWKELYKMSSNWKSGKCKVTELWTDSDPWLRRSVQADGRHRSEGVEGRPPSEGVTPKQPIAPAVTAAANGKGPDRPETLVQSCSNLILTASRRVPQNSRPSVQVYHDQAAKDQGPSDGPEPHDPTLHRPILSLRSHRLISESPVTISDLKVDRSTEQNVDEALVRVFVGYSDASWSIFEVSSSQDGSPLSSQTGTLRFEETFCQPGNLGSPTKPAVLSALHFPLLVTCSEDFTISIFRLDKGEPPRLIRRTTSQSCYWPATMTLSMVPTGQPADDRPAKLGKRSRSRSPPTLYKKPSFAMLKQRRQGRSHVQSIRQQAELEEPQTFRLGIAYCTPSYPDNWTVSLQEISVELGSKGSPIIISRYATATPRISAGTASPSRSVVPSRKRPDSGNVSSEEDVAPPSVPSPIPRSIFERSPGKASTGQAVAPYTPQSVNRIKTLSYDEPYLVCGSDDNLLELYEIGGSLTRASHSQLKGDPLTLRHSKVLYGHMGSVLTCALEDGRCVSGSSDGTVMVWTTGAQASDEEDLTTRSDMTHLVTLRPRSRDSQDATTEAKEEGPFHLPSLNDLLVQIRKAASETASLSATPRKSQIKWVSTTFDRILSVSVSQKGQDQEDQAQQETVQVWSFGR